MSSRKNKFVEVESPTYNTVKLASGAPVIVKQQVKVKFTIGNHHFSDSFLVLPTMNTVILGNPVFKKNFIDISPAYNLLKLPEMTIQRNEIKPKDKKRQTSKKLKKIPLLLSKKHELQPNSHQLLECYLDKSFPNLENCSGVIIPCTQFENETEIALTSSLSTLDEKSRVFISALNILTTK